MKTVDKIRAWDRGFMKKYHRHYLLTCGGDWDEPFTRTIRVDPCGLRKQLAREKVKFVFFYAVAIFRRYVLKLKS